MTPTLSPAFGRDYQTASEATDAYIEGSDWVLTSPPPNGAVAGTYCSCRDFANKRVKLRYKNLTQVTFVTSYITI